MCVNSSRDRKLSELFTQFSCFALFLSRLSTLINGVTSLPNVLHIQYRLVVPIM